MYTWERISMKVFNEVKKESMEGHSPAYSALFHDIPQETVDNVLKSPDYKSYQMHITNHWPYITKAARP